ncbi:hypothetical protein BDZ97DRAFT_1373896 [Flammula alnicola]|nr:hypothetical protein BDZ97DRAFT_1373896 [Flammula alnicola]
MDRRLSVHQVVHGLFIPQATARNSSNTPILLIYYGHGSHDTFKIIDFAISHGIISFVFTLTRPICFSLLTLGVFGPFQKPGLSAATKSRTTPEEMPRQDFVKEYMHVRAATFKRQQSSRHSRKAASTPSIRKTLLTRTLLQASQPRLQRVPFLRAIQCQTITPTTISMQPRRMRRPRRSKRG